MSNYNGWCKEEKKVKEKLKYISNNIKSYRVKKGYTQEEVANKMGVSRNTYCDYEVNLQRVRVETLQQIAEILDCKVSDFFKENNVTKSNIRLEE